MFITDHQQWIINNDLTATLRTNKLDYPLAHRVMTNRVRSTCLLVKMYTSWGSYGHTNTLNKFHKLYLSNTCPSGFSSISYCSNNEYWPLSLNKKSILTLHWLSLFIWETTMGNKRIPYWTLSICKRRKD